MGEDLFDALKARWADLIELVGMIDHLKGENRRFRPQGELQPVTAGCGAMLDSEMQLLTIASQIQIGVAPGMQF